MTMPEMPKMLEERDPPLMEPEAVALAYAEQVMAYVKHFSDDPTLSPRKVAEYVAGSMLAMFEGRVMTLPGCKIEPEWREGRDELLKKNNLPIDPIYGQFDIGQDLLHQFERLLLRERMSEDLPKKEDPNYEPTTMAEFAKRQTPSAEQVVEATLGDGSPKPLPVLEWGETPFARMPRLELELHACRLYDALTSIHDKFRMAVAMHLSDVDRNPFSRAAIARANYAIEQVQSGYAAENIHHSFFRYAEPLLYKGNDAAVETTWKRSTHLVDNKLIGLTHEQRHLQPYSGYGYRDINWDDLKPKSKS